VNAHRQVKRKYAGFQLKRENKKQPFLVAV